MTLDIIASRIPSLKPLFNILKTVLTRITSRRDTTSHQTTATSRRAFESYSNHHYTHRRRFPTLSTLIFPRPKPAYFQTEKNGLKRFHDPASNVTFDIEIPPPRLPRTWVRHNWAISGLSRFTNFSLPLDLNEFSRPIGSARRESRGFFDIDVEVGSANASSGYAVSVTSGDVAYESLENSGSIERKACQESNLGLKTSGESKEKKIVMGIMRTTTTEVTIV